MTFLKTITDIFGESVLADDTSTTFIPTGSLSLESAIGVPGLPRGRFTELYGPEGSAKTSLALNFAKQNYLVSGGKTLYIDAENMLDYNYASAMAGIAIDRDYLVIVQPDTAEDAFVVAEKGIESGEFSLIVIDSVGALAPKFEKEEEFDKASVAIIPKLLAKFLRRNVYAIKDHNIAFLFINQVRDSIGSYVKSYSTPGGHALKHFTSLIISLTKGEQIKVGKEVVGINVNFSIRKNKLSSPFRGYTIPLVFGKGIDTYRDAINFAQTCGVVVRSGSIYKFEGEVLGRGMNDAVANLESKPETLDRIKEVVYNIGKQKPIETEEDDDE